MEGILAVIFLFGGGTLFLLSISPVGRAMADRMRAQSPPMRDPELLAEVDALRQEVAELHERVDFAERILLSGCDRRELKNGEPALFFWARLRFLRCPRHRLMLRLSTPIWCS